jgi:hypothetical protein
MNMERTSETGSRKFSIKVEAKELDRIVQARKNLDDVKALAIYATQYRDLGWSPVALEIPHGTDLRVDFHQPDAKCLWSLMDLALQGIVVGLAIRLDPDPPLFVVRVKPALGLTLDRLGNWRSPCMARLGEAWEHHFLVLPETWSIAAEHIIGDAEAPLSILGPGHSVMVPPSADPASQVLWHWLAPPWEQPPGEPSPELLILLEDCGFISRKSLISVEELPTWKEIYPLIRHAEGLLQALLAPEESSAWYYRKILQEALQAGFQDLHLLLGLLWHAPHSELRLDPGGRGQLAQWAEKLEGLLSKEPLDVTGDTPEYGEGVAAPPPHEGLLSELDILAAQTRDLEQQLEKLEDLRAAGETREEGGPHSEAEDSLEELEDLRQSVEDFLAGIKNLPKPE